MAPKSKDGGKATSAKGKGKGKDDESGGSGSGKLKSAQSINVRHILVGHSLRDYAARECPICKFLNLPR
jgi:hypothetical protein